MIQNISKTFESRDAKVKEFEASVKAYDAETKRITAVQASMSPEQIQDIVMGTVHGMITSGDLIGEMPGQDTDVGPEAPQESMEQQPPPEMQGAPQ